MGGKKMNQNHKRTMILAGIIGMLFACYDEKEKTRLHKELHEGVGRGIRKQVKLYSIKEVMEVTHKDGNDIWGKAVDHFLEREITIEASACVLALWNLDEKALAKHFGLSRSKIGQWAKPSKRADRRELEIASREVAKYVWGAINALYGIEEEKKMSVLERIRLMKEMA
jgi:hypothetical protein